MGGTHYFFTNRNVKSKQTKEKEGKPGVNNYWGTIIEHIYIKQRTNVIIPNYNASISMPGPD